MRYITHENRVKREVRWTENVLRRKIQYVNAYHDIIYRGIVTGILAEHSCEIGKDIDEERAYNSFSRYTVQFTLMGIPLYYDFIAGWYTYDEKDVKDNPYIIPQEVVDQLALLRMHHAEYKSARKSAKKDRLFSVYEEAFRHYHTHYAEKYPIEFHQSGEIVFVGAEE